MIYFQNFILKSKFFWLLIIKIHHLIVKDANTMWISSSWFLSLKFYNCHCSTIQAKLCRSESEWSWDTSTYLCKVNQSVLQKMIAKNAKHTMEIIFVLILLIASSEQQSKKNWYWYPFNRVPLKFELQVEHLKFKLKSIYLLSSTNHRFWHFEYRIFVAVFFRLKQWKNQNKYSKFDMFESMSCWGHK